MKKSTPSAVRTRELRKTFVVSEREAGMRAALRSLVHRPKKDIHAVDGYATLRVPKAETARATERLLADLPVIDLTVEDPPLEEVIERVFTQEAV